MVSELVGKATAWDEPAKKNARIADLEKALKPFSDAVFNDNGDMTINMGFAQYDDYVRAYFALRRSALEASNA